MDASIAIDNRTVTFTGLFRARYGTDIVLTHNVGDIVIPYQTDVVNRSIAALDFMDSRTPALQLNGVGSNNVNKRLDVQLDPYALMEQGAYSVHRKDEANDILLFMGTRLSNLWFTDTLEYVVGNNAFINAYFLNAPYDEALFNSLKADPFEGTYIIGMSQSFSTFVGDIGYWVSTYAEGDQLAFGFDKDVDDLNVVLIAHDEEGFLDRYGEKASRRLIMRWSPGIYNTPIRGRIM
jgi:hypothetical protein